MVDECVGQGLTHHEYLIKMKVNQNYEWVMFYRPIEMFVCCMLRKTMNVSFNKFKAGNWEM